MQILKNILLTLLGIIVLILVIAIFVPREYAVERAMTIDLPASEVFDYVVLLKNQDNYSVWAQKDPNMKKTFTGEDGTVGFVSAWESDDEEVGSGEQEIIKIERNFRIDYEIRFYEPFEATDNAYMITEVVSSNQTKIKWGFNGKFPYPMNLMLLFVNMEDELGTALSDGLNNLQAILENQY